LDDIEFLSPPGAIKPTGPWSLGVRAGDFVFVAGMRGIDPATNKLVEGDEARIRQAFVNMKTIVAAAGGSLRDAMRLVVYVTDMGRYRPLVIKSRRSFGAARPIRRVPSLKSPVSIRTTSWKWKERSIVRRLTWFRPTVTFRICRADPSPAPP
jgi:enamine deaminase RidA (YjgF/YER057c/UK114 family)